MMRLVPLLSIICLGLVAFGAACWAKRRRQRKRKAARDRTPSEFEQLVGMTSHQERAFVREYAARDFKGEGAIVDLGCWMGSFTLPLAIGLRENPRISGRKVSIHAYDLFSWQGWMNPSVAGTRWAGRYKEGAGDLNKETREPTAPIEYLLIDAMKSWEPANRYPNSWRTTGLKGLEGLPARGRPFTMASAMDRLLLIGSTLCYFVAVARTALSLRAGVFRPGRFSFFAIVAGFVLQTAFLSVRGHAVGRCPITNLFEVFVFLAWSVALIYMLVGPAYRLSLMGAFTAPLVFAIQTFALLAPIDVPHRVRLPANSWLEFHASISMIAYGAFALACVAGLMYLVQERQLKTHHLHSIFYHLPPLNDLFAAITRLLWLGFALYTAGLMSGFFTGQPLPGTKIVCAFGVWVFYSAILWVRHFGVIAPKRVAVLCVLAFAAAVSILWGITFVSERSTLQ